MRLWRADERRLPVDKRISRLGHAAKAVTAGSCRATCMVWQYKSPSAIAGRPWRLPPVCCGVQAAQEKSVLRCWVCDGGGMGGLRQQVQAVEACTAAEHVRVGACSQIVLALRTARRDRVGDELHVHAPAREAARKR